MYNIISKNIVNMLFTTTLLLSMFIGVSAQNLCTPSSDTPQCAIQFNGNYINCYCVVDPISKTVTRRVVLNQSADDLNLCANSNQNTFCCPFNFLDRSNTFVYNGFVYDRMCKSLGIYTPPPPSQLSTTNIEAFVTLLVTPASPSSTITTPPTITSTVVSTQIVPTTTTLISTQIVPTTTTLISTLTQIIPTITTIIVPTITTFTETVYPTPTVNQAIGIIPTPLPTVTKTVTKTVIRTRIYRTTIK